jgi:hypothetical protein
MTADEFVSALKQATPSFEEMVLNGEILEYARRFSQHDLGVSNGPWGQV